MDGFCFGKDGFLGEVDEFYVDYFPSFFFLSYYICGHLVHISKLYFSS